MANPRKFSEKIALQKQKQAEGTAEFEKIMKEVYATKMDESQASQKILECCLANNDSATSSAATNNTNSVGIAGGGGGGGGSGGSSGGGGGASPEGGGGGNSSPTAYRESRGRSVGVGPMRRPSERKQDRSPYGSSTTVTAPAVSGGGIGNNGQNIAYLSPPMDTSWRRSNSDSALHQTLNMAVAAEGGFGPGGMAGIMGGLSGELNSLHAGYQHQNHSQRSHSPNIGRSYSPQAIRRKGLMNQQQQQQHLSHHPQQHHMQLQQMQQHFQHQQNIQQHQQQQQQQHHNPHQQHHNNQQQSNNSNFNAKFSNCNLPVNSQLRSLQEQAMAFGISGSGSLPDLTSVRYSTPTTQQHLQLVEQQQQLHQQQQTLSPILSPHNNLRDRDQSTSPFSPAGVGGGGGGGPPSPYHQQQNSPTSAAHTPTAAQTSPHLSFTNLSVQSPGTTSNPAQPGTGSGNGNGTGTSTIGGNLPTLGAASSTGNLTDYRQPLNPPSPGSSPGLLTSVSGNELHTSAPPSPIRHAQTQNLQQQSMQGFSDKNIQTFDGYGAGNVDSSYNSLNPSFHNHFEQFSLGDSNSSPEQQQQLLQQHFQQHQQQNDFTTLEFEDFVSSSSAGGAVNGPSQPTYSQTNLVQNKFIDFNDLSSVVGSSGRGTTIGDGVGGTNANATATAGVAGNNNNLQQQSAHSLRQQQQQQQQQQQILNNNRNSNGGNDNSRASNQHSSQNSSSANVNAQPHGRNNGNNNVNLSQQSEARQDILASPVPSPLGCVPQSSSSPLPIPLSPQSPHQQQQQQHHHHHHNHHLQQQLSLSLHSQSAQHSPHHSPMHSPHHTSPLSVSSPSGGGISPVNSVIGNAAVSSTTQQATATHNSQHHHHQQQQQQQPQSHANTPTTTNIPSIIFSDYSSNYSNNSDFSREIFDSLDLDLGQMDVAGIQMLTDQSTIMIADPTIEDSFRRDLN